MIFYFFIVYLLFIIFIFLFCFFFNDTATTEIYTLSLHDALPICCTSSCVSWVGSANAGSARMRSSRSEEHTSELQSRPQLVCRLLLEKKKIHRGGLARKIGDHEQNHHGCGRRSK